MKNRNAGIELLRIVLMFMVAVLHIINAGGVIDAARGANFWSLQVLKTAAFCAANGFALISGYVGWNKRFQYQKMLYFWLQIAFYTVGVTLVAGILAPEVVARRDYLYCLIPITSHQYWYATEYFGLMILMPLLNSGIQNIEKDLFSKLVELIFLLIVCLTTLCPMDAYGLLEGYTLVWLVILYIFGGYLNRFECLTNIPKTTAWIVYILSVAVSVVFCTVGKYGPQAIRQIWDPEALIAYNSPTMVVASIALLSVFEKIKIPENAEKLILYLSPAAFGVYLLHAQPISYRNIISGISVSLAACSVPVMLLMVMAEALTILVIGLCVELLRIHLFRLLRVQEWCEKAVNALHK